MSYSFIALAAEIGEMAEILQFRGDDNNVATSLSVQQLDKIAQELADVTIYICRLSDVCKVPMRPT
jgi:dCTP diphosphatase